LTRKPLFRKRFLKWFLSLSLSLSLPFSFNAPFFYIPSPAKKNNEEKKRKFMFGDFLLIIVISLKGRNRHKNLGENFDFCHLNLTNYFSLFFRSENVSGVPVYPWAGWQGRATQQSGNSRLFGGNIRIKSSSSDNPMETGRRIPSVSGF